MIPVDIARPLHSEAPPSWVLCPPEPTAFRRAVRYEARLGEETCERFVTEYLAGAGVQAIATGHGISRPACQALLERRGVEIRSPWDYVRRHHPRTAVALVR